MKGGADFEPQFLSREFRDVVRQRSAGRLKITASLVGKMNNAVGLVDNHARRGGPLQRLAMDLGFAWRSLRERGRRPGWQRLCAERDSRCDPNFRRYLRPLINSRLTVDGAKHIRRIIRAFGRTEKQIAERSQGKVKSAANMLLQLTIEIDQHVSAGDEIDARERRVFEKAVLGEQDHVAQFANDSETGRPPG